jgi:hypothetical protein
MRNERFLVHRRSKLHPRGDGMFQVLKRIKDNACKIDFLGKHCFSATFNVFDISLFDVGYGSRLKPFENRRNDKNHQASPNDPLRVLIGPITRSMTKKINTTIQ